MVPGPPDALDLRLCSGAPPVKAQDPLSLRFHCYGAALPCHVPTVMDGDGGGGPWQSPVTKIPVAMFLLDVNRNPPIQVGVL